MESCLTLTRSFYGQQEATIQEFLTAHPTLNKQRLLSKILAQMMIKCVGEINDSQIAVLQDYKHQPDTFDHKRAGYPDLINIDWELLKY